MYNLCPRLILRALKLFKMTYTILMNGRNFQRNKFNTLAECKERIFTAKNIFRHSTFYVIVNALTHTPKK